MPRKKKVPTPVTVSKEQLIRTVPKRLHASITDDLIDTLNSNITDPEFREIYRENLLGFTNVITEGKYKLQGYMDAVKFVSYKFIGCTDIESYTKTFPDRYQRLIDEKCTNKQISSYVSAFRHTKLVQKIFEQTMIPVHIRNMDIYQKAVETQANLMITANSEKVRCDAANSLMTQLKPPETKKIELDVGLKQSKTLDDLRAATSALADAWKEGLDSKTLTPLQIANAKIVTDEEIIETE
jgi:hypothetical protein